VADWLSRKWILPVYITEQTGIVDTRRLFGDEVVVDILDESVETIEGMSVEGHCGLIEVPLHTHEFSSP
jgi:hypothetical protein